MKEKFKLGLLMNSKGEIATQIKFSFNGLRKEELSEVIVNLNLLSKKLESLYEKKYLSKNIEFGND